MSSDVSREEGCGVLGRVGSVGVWLCSCAAGSGPVLLCLACVSFFLGWTARPSWMTVRLERLAEDGMS